MHTDTSLHGDIAISMCCRAAGALLGLLCTNIDSMCLELLLKLLLELLLELLLQLLLLLGQELLPFRLGYPIGNSSMKGLVIQLGVIPKPFYECLLECHLKGLDAVGDLVPLQLPPGKV